jgi:hypothetical protein
MAFPIADTTKHSKQPVSIWLIHEQKTVDVKRTVYQTNSGAYIKYQGCLVYVRGSTKTGWHGNY